MDSGREIRGADNESIIDELSIKNLIDEIKMVAIN